MALERHSNARHARHPRRDHDDTRAIRLGLVILGLVTMATAASCRFGGPSGDPLDPTMPDADVLDAGGSTNPGEGSGHGSGGGAESGTPSSPVLDGQAPSDADLGSDATAGDLDGANVGDSGVDASLPRGDGGCAPPFVSAVCDPVCNTGCGLFNRCDVSDKVHEGVCVGALWSGEGIGCLRVGTIDPCTASLACIDGNCRRLCYADADCSAGTCCNRSVDANGTATGFRWCSTC